MLNVTITDRAMRDRLASDLKRMRDQIAEMKAQPPNPKAGRAIHHAAALRSAKSDARDLSGHIRKWDAANRTAAKTARGKGRQLRRGATQGPGDHGLAKRGGNRPARQTGAGQLARTRAPRTKAPRTRTTDTDA